MNSETQRWLLATMTATKVTEVQTLHELWGGYGELNRIKLLGAQRDSVIIKDIRFPPPKQQHPRGWSSDFAHQRKLQSYRVERQWYQSFAAQCTVACYCPQVIAVRDDTQGQQILLEDLTPKFPMCPAQIELPQVKRCLSWLAHFHATFLHVEPSGLWEQGSYWHLATRPHEWEVMQEGPLKQNAAAIDQRLLQTDFLTLIHGDAKLDNFCFAADGHSVAAVDFQYVGAGCGMKDVIYFFSSCLSEADCFDHADRLLDFYFSVLDRALFDKFNADQRYQLSKQWRSLYNFAWADFQRFLMGWSPQHWKLNPYVDEKTNAALQQLADGKFDAL